MQHLADPGAFFYETWWCYHCQDQKQLFGQKEAQIMPYAEFSTPEGQGQTPECQKVSTKGLAS
jgi:hypothetical protein